MRSMIPALAGRLARLSLTCLALLAAGMTCAQPPSPLTTTTKDTKLTFLTKPEYHSNGKFAGSFVVPKITITIDFAVPTDEMMKAFFSQFDKNGNGQIDLTEFRTAMSLHLDTPLRPHDDRGMSDLFRRLDVGDPKTPWRTQNKQLDYQEFVALFLSKVVY